MKTKSQLNRKVQLAFAAAIITMLAEGTICYRGLVATVESDQWVRLSCEALCSGMLEAAPRNGCRSSNAQVAGGRHWMAVAVAVTDESRTATGNRRYITSDWVSRNS
jgi:hypothetical protein